MSRQLRRAVLALVLMLGGFAARRWIQVKYLPDRLWAAAESAQKTGRYPAALDRYEEFFIRYPDDRRTGAILGRVVACLKQTPAGKPSPLADVKDLYLLFWRGGFDKGAGRMRELALPIAEDYLANFSRSRFEAAGLGLAARRVPTFGSGRELLILAFEYHRGRPLGPPKTALSPQEPAQDSAPEVSR